MLNAIKRYFKSVKEYPIITCISIVVGGGLGYLVFHFIERIIDDVSKGLENGTFNSLNVLALIGSVAGLASLGWQIFNKYKTNPEIIGSVEIIDKKGIPETLLVEVKNYGRTVDVNRIGFRFSDNEHEYYRYHMGLVQKRVMAGGIPYKEEFDIKDIVKYLRNHNTSLKYAFIEDDNTKKYKIKISLEVIYKVDIIKKQISFS